MKQTLGVGISAGIIAALLVEVGEAKFGVLSWVCFVAMLSYYTTECGKTGFIKSTCCNISGLIWGYLIILISGILPIAYSMGITVVVIVILMCMQSCISWLSFIPGTFAGAACYFGTGFDFKAVIIALLVGNVAAWVSQVLGGKLGNILEGNKKKSVVTD
ncbi:MAG: DUF1097 domain-containing protein [Clostridia bacterium]|nr:DUF1097 domain-containing protein [Clostridia bacterium]